MEEGSLEAKIALALDEHLNNHCDDEQCRYFGKDILVFDYLYIKHLTEVIVDSMKDHNS